MTQIANRFVWSSRSKIDQIENVGDPLEFADQTQSNSNHLRGMTVAEYVDHVRDAYSDWASSQEEPTQAQ